MHDFHVGSRVFIDRSIVSAGCYHESRALERAQMEYEDKIAGSCLKMVSIAFPQRKDVLDPSCGYMSGRSVGFAELGSQRLQVLRPVGFSLLRISIVLPSDRCPFKVGYRTCRGRTSYLLAPGCCRRAEESSSGVRTATVLKSEEVKLKGQTSDCRCSKFLCLGSLAPK
jgi:hypothetical protein